MTSWTSNPRRPPGGAPNYRKKREMNNRKKRRTTLPKGVITAQSGKQADIKLDLDIERGMAGGPATPEYQPQEGHPQEGS